MLYIFICTALEIAVWNTNVVCTWVLYSILNYDLKYFTIFKYVFI